MKFVNYCQERFAKIIRKQHLQIFLPGLKNGLSRQKEFVWINWMMNSFYICFHIIAAII